MACGPQNSKKCETFVTATQARDRSLCHEDIWAEIHEIQSKILSAIKNCELSITISDGTPITYHNSITDVTINNGGVDYNTVSATASITHPTGTGADVVPVVTNGVITDFTINAGGTGYDPVEATADASAEGDGTAVFEVVVNSDGEVETVYVLAGGSNYSVNDPITIVHPFGSGAVVEVATVDINGTILSTVVKSGGTGYDPVKAEITVSHPDGINFEGNVIINSGSVVDVSITNGGSGYRDLEPEITVDSANGSGAEFSITTDVSGTITGITVVNGGSGYDSSDIVTVNAVPGTGGNGADLELVVDTISTTIDPVHYYNVWNKLETDKLSTLQLEFISNYFTCLGYNFQIKTNADTGNTLKWVVSW